MAPKVVNRLENEKLFAYFKPCKKYLEFSNYYYSTTARANEHFLADIRWELFFVFYFSSIESTKFLRIITSLHMRFSRGFQCVKFVEIWITAYSISINCCYKMSVFLGKKLQLLTVSISYIVRIPILIGLRKSTHPIQMNVA